MTRTHHYPDLLPYAVSGTATSTTNVTAAAVLRENSTFGYNGTIPTDTGKTVQGLIDANSVGVDIASVVDENNNTYVLSIDGKRMAVTRFTPNGQIDSGTSGWTTSGTHILPVFTLDRMGTTRNLLYVSKQKGCRTFGATGSARPGSCVRFARRSANSLQAPLNQSARAPTVRVLEDVLRAGPLPYASENGLRR